MSDRAKIIACWLGACLLFTLIVSAADITPGYTFTSGEKNITHTKLNDAASGSINTTFITSKSAQTAEGADVMVYYATADAGFRKTTLSTLFGNAPAINGLSTINSVGDFSVATSKFTVSATTGNTAVGGNLTVATNLTVSGTTTLVGLTTSSSISGGSSITATTTIQAGTDLTWFGRAVGSLGGSLYVSGATTNAGDVYLGDAAGDTLTLNGTLAGTLQGTPTVSLTAVSAASGDSVLISDVSDSGKLKMALVSTLIARTNILLGSFPAPGGAITNAHSLGGWPQMVNPVLVCTNSEAGYAVGDELSVYSTIDDNRATPSFVTLPTSTNVVMVYINSAGGNPRLAHRTTGAMTSITPTNWNLKVYLAYFP